MAINKGHVIDELVGDLITPREMLVRSYAPAAAEALVPPEAANATAGRDAP